MIKYNNTSSKWHVTKGWTDSGHSVLYECTSFNMLHSNNERLSVVLRCIRIRGNTRPEGPESFRRTSLPQNFDVRSERGVDSPGLSVGRDLIYRVPVTQYDPISKLSVGRRSLSPCFGPDRTRQGGIEFHNVRDPPCPRSGSDEVRQGR